jgi:hypothetical protein
MPFTPSMKLNAFTNPVTQSAMTTTTATRPAGGRLSRLTSTAAAAMLPAACSTSRRRTESPLRSSANPITPKAATAMAKATPAESPMSSAASTSPTAIGAPPPRGVGTLWDDRRLGTSNAAARRSSEMVTGSATTTTPPHESAAIMIVSSSDTAQPGPSCWDSRVSRGHGRSRPCLLPLAAPPGVVPLPAIAALPLADAGLPAAVSEGSAAP